MTVILLRPWTRAALLALAGDDLPAALAAVVPFVLAHPREAPVLRDLEGLAVTDADRRAFDMAAAALVATAVRAESDRDAAQAGAGPRPASSLVVGTGVDPVTPRFSGVCSTN